MVDKLSLYKAAIGEIEMYVDDLVINRKINEKYGKHILSIVDDLYFRLSKNYD